MKIKVVQKASATRKPQNYCPWAIDDWSPRNDSK
jgi:hypothetical protein